MDKIIFKGYINDRNELYQLYADSKIFCFPSRTESFGISLVEASYFGNYILSTDVGAAPDLLSIYGYGELLDIDDPQGLAMKLQKLIKNLPNRDTISGSAELIKENYNWKTLCNKIVKKIK
jgi:glycosyltransferase involved in cell wall biosynthesis